MNERADYPTISRNVATTDGVYVGANTVHLEDDQMQVGLSIKVLGFGCNVTSYLTVDQARQLSAALIECADQYESVRKQVAA